MVFICPRCRYETAFKCNLKKHLSRKKQCKPTHSNMNPETVICVMNASNNEALLERESQHTHTIDELVAEIHKLQNIIRDRNLEIKPNTNNIQNIQKSVQTQNTVPYGKENTDHVTKEYVQNLVKHGVYGSITKLVFAIHFDDKHPENRNIRITNERSKFAHIYDGSKFTRYPKDFLLKELIDRSIDIIDEALFDTDDIPPVYKRFLKELDENVDKIYKNLALQIECLILNHSIF